MNNVRELFAIGRMALITIFALIFLFKIILFYKYEKEWNSITFFHFNKIQLKMTVSKELRKWRKRQNNLTSFMLLIILFLAIAFGFNLLIKE